MWSEVGEIGKRKGERGPGGRNGIDDINESIWSRGRGSVYTVMNIEYRIGIVLLCSLCSILLLFK